jgi:hypothetical protein
VLERTGYPLDCQLRSSTGFSPSRGEEKNAAGQRNGVLLILQGFARMVSAIRMVDRNVRANPGRPNRQPFFVNVLFSGMGLTALVDR